MGVLNASLSVVGEEIDGEQPFEIYGLTIGEDSTEDVERILRERHEEFHPQEPFSPDAWRAHIASRRVLLDGAPISSHELQMARGQKLEFVGATTAEGCVLRAIAGGRDASDVAKALAKWLTPRADFIFCGSMLKDLVRWNQLPPSASGWSELIALLEESAPFLHYTGADWLLLIAAAHVFGPISIFHTSARRGIRFVAEDAYAHAAQLPASSGVWIRLGVLDNGHFVRCRSKQVKAQELLHMLDEIESGIADQIPADIPDAFIFLAPSKTGKSTFTNVINGKIMYVATPQSRMKRKKQAALAVLGEAVKGSRIGVGKISETLLINVCVIEVESKQVAIVDTPGMMGSQAALIEIVNAVSISKCMARFKTLRVILMTREDALVNGTAEAFVQAAATVTTLFSGSVSIASAVQNMVLWVNPHQPKSDFDHDGIIEELEGIAKARPEIREFLRALISESKRWKKIAPMIHMIEYDEKEVSGDKREEILIAREKYLQDAGLPADEDMSLPVYRADFNVDELIRNMIHGGGARKMENPADKIGLPLTLKAEHEISVLAAELQESIVLRAELYDYLGAKHRLDIAKAIVNHMHMPSSTSHRPPNGTFESAYRKALSELCNRLLATFGHTRIRELCHAIVRPSPIEQTQLTDISFALRASAYAAILEAHVVPHLGASEFQAAMVTESSLVVNAHVEQLPFKSLRNLDAQFINGSCDEQTAPALFQQLHHDLTKCKVIQSHFSLEVKRSGSAVYSDAELSEAERAFAIAVERTAETAYACISKICDAVARGMDIQVQTAYDLVRLCLNRVPDVLATAALLCANDISELHVQEDVPEASPTCLAALAIKNGPLEAAANVLSLLRMAEDTLADDVSSLRGMYEGARQRVIMMLQEQSRMAVARIEQEDHGAFASVMAKLLFLLQARSSSLRQHFPDTAVLDNFYEDLVQKVVRWHEQVVEVVLKATKKDSISFTEQIADHRSQVELSMKLSALADVESIQSGDAGTINSKKWVALRGRRDELVKHIGIAIHSFAGKAESKLDEHKRAVISKNQELLEIYEYSQHSVDLATLERALWCDSILVADGEGGSVIKTCILKLWHAFEQHMLLLARGEDGAISRLNAGKYKLARTLLMQLQHMEQLWKGAQDDEAQSILLSEGACGADIARRLAKIHDDTRKSVHATIAEKCAKVHSKVLKEGLAWMDGSVKGANVIGRQGALGQLDMMLNLANELLSASGSNSLEGWLDLEDVERMQTVCRNMAVDFKDKLRNRVKALFNGLSACELQLIDESVRILWSAATGYRGYHPPGADLLRENLRVQAARAEMSGLGLSLHAEGVNSVPPPPPKLSAGPSQRCEADDSDQYVDADEFDVDQFVDEEKGERTAKSGQRPPVDKPAGFAAELLAELGAGLAAEQATTSQAQVTAACEEVMAILRLLSRPSEYPAFFAAVRDAFESSSSSGDALLAPLNFAPFYELGRLYQSAHVDSIITFSAPETEVAARLKALLIFKTISEITPDDDLFKVFRKSHENFYPTLVKASQDAGNRINTEIKAAFASHEFTDETYQTMKQLQLSRSHNKNAELAYKKACSLLHDNVHTVISLLKMGFTSMQHPEQGLSPQEHLVKPWSKLEAARTHACFLRDTLSDAPLDLELTVVELQKTFQSVFKERVLQPLIDKFDLGYYSDAEGVPGSPYGLTWVSKFVMHLQSSQCTLEKAAREALDETRKYQRKMLAVPPRLPKWDVISAPTDSESSSDAPRDAPEADLGTAPTSAYTSALKLLQATPSKKMLLSTLCAILNQQGFKSEMAAAGGPKRYFLSSSLPVYGEAGSEHVTLPEAAAVIATSAAAAGTSPFLVAKGARSSDSNAPPPHQPPVVSSGPGEGGGAISPTEMSFIQLKKFLLSHQRVPQDEISGATSRAPLLALVGKYGLGATSGSTATSAAAITTPSITGAASMGVTREASGAQNTSTFALGGAPPAASARAAASLPTGGNAPLESEQEALKNPSLFDRVHVLDRWFLDCHTRSLEMDKCARGTELAREYSNARDLIDNEVRRALHKEFDMLLSRDFLSLDSERVEYLEKLQLTIASSSYAASARRLIDLESVKSQIKNWSTAQDLNPEAFEELPYDKQAEMIKSTDPRKPEFQDMVRHFHAAHKEATQRAEKLLVSPAIDLPPNAVSEVFKEIRGRRSLGRSLAARGVQFDDAKQRELEDKALEMRKRLENQILSTLQTRNGRESWDMALKQQLQRLLDFAKAARAPPPGSKEAKEILDRVNIILQETIEQSEGSVDSARQAAVTSAALLRLKRWEPSDAALDAELRSADQGMFEIVADLEAALAEEGSIDACTTSTSRRQHLRTCAFEHLETRRGNTTAKIDAMINGAQEALQRKYDPKKDKALDPQPFETLLSAEMANLVQEMCPELNDKIKELQSSVKAKAQEHYLRLKSSLDKKDYKAASEVFYSWKFVEPVASLNAFSQVPGETAFNEELKKHAEVLAQEAKVLIQSSGLDQLRDVAKRIIILSKFGSDIDRASTYAADAINEVLARAEAKFHISGMQALANELRKIDPAIGNEVISSSNSFKTLVIAEFNEKTKRDIGLVKKLFVERNPKIGEQVWRKHEEFKRYYDRYLERCIQGTVGHIEDPLAFLVNEARGHVSNDKSADRDFLSRGTRFIGLTNHNQQEVPKVLAAIFAWWTIEFYLNIKTQHASFTADAAKLRQANDVQVVCILRLLGATSDTSLVDVQNHLAEVPTGEGKSVTIGVLATTLALYGYHVDCVCYSSMLSKRDYEDFKSMFESFGLNDKIRYGTFDTLSEELLKERHGDLRSLATASLAREGKRSGGLNPLAELPMRVMIVDEVDVFCSATFLGGTYSPSAQIEGPQVVALLRHVWSLRLSRLDMNSIAAHESYRSVLESGLVSASNAWFLQQAVVKMHSLMSKGRPKRKYVIQNGRIAYKVAGRDEYSTDWTYAWETNAAYFFAFESSEITEQQLASNLALFVSCGQLAYARLPKAFERILGVTGTLDESKLPPQMHDVLKKEVGIQHFTYCPSMYHAKKRDWDPTDKTYVQLAADEDEHFNLITDEIQTRLKPLKKVDDQRSVIVFFKDVDELNRFRDSSYFNRYREMAGVLTEITAMTPESRDSIIKAATRQGMVTLATKAYGRGTDFKIFDDRMEDCGGMHVLQTFFSCDISEEVQIQGRCARQGHKGSFSMVLKVGALVTDFNLREADVKAWPSNELYGKLCQCRTSKALKEVETLRTRASECKKEHDQTVKAISAGPEAMAKFVRTQNNGRDEDED